MPRRLSRGPGQRFLKIRAARGIWKHPVKPFYKLRHDRGRNHPGRDTERERERGTEREREGSERNREWEREREKEMKPDGQEFSLFKKPRHQNNELVFSVFEWKSTHPGRLSHFHHLESHLLSWEGKKRPQTMCQVKLEPLAVSASGFSHLQWALDLQEFRYFHSEQQAKQHENADFSLTRQYKVDKRINMPKSKFATLSFMPKKKQ